MKIIACEQGSPEWFLARRGIPTASCFDRILTPKQCKPSAQAEEYIAELIGDLYNPGVPDRAENFTTRAMQNGIDLEPEARRWYEMHVDQDVQRVGFVVSDCGRWGCSPDGLVGEDGLLELKCPMLKTQVKYLLAGTLPDEYRCQVHGQLIVTGRKWVDFASYASARLQPLLIRVEPDAFTDKLRTALEAFSERYAEVLRMIREGETNE